MFEPFAVLSSSVEEGGHGTLDVDHGAIQNACFPQKRLVQIRFLFD